MATMTFQDFMKKLAHSQLKNTSAVDDAQLGEIDVEYQDQILELTNQGITDICTRLKLFEGVVPITFVDDQHVYPITEPTFIKALEIHNSKEKVFIPKSNSHITVPSPDTLRFSSTFMSLHGPEVDVHYQALHPEVAMDGDINLPLHLFEALALYVSGLYISHMGSSENTGKGDSYYGLYIQMMTTDEVRNSSGTSEINDEDTRFQDRGFV